MEHANKAIMMAFGMMVAVMILGAVVFVFTKLKSFPMQDDDNASIEQRRLFNQEYEVYDKRIMYGVDVISVLNKAKSNNEKYVEGNFLSGNLYSTDYIINIVVKFTEQLSESFEVTYLDTNSSGVVERQYAAGGPKGVNAKSVFKAPNESYQKLFYNDEHKWENLTLETRTINTGIARGATKARPKAYQLMGTDPSYSGRTLNGVYVPDADGTTHYTDNMINPDKIKDDPTLQFSVLYELIGQTTNMSQSVKNRGSNKYGMYTGWSKATWYPAVYGLKTKKFKCNGDKTVYSPKTGRIVYMEFEQL